MKNNDERRAYIRNELNWKVYQATDLNTVDYLEYKGERWFRIRIREYAHHYDYVTRTHGPRVCMNQLGGFYRYNTDENYLVHINGESNIIDEMRSLDKRFPDRKGALPDTIAIVRRGKQDG